MNSRPWHRYYPAGMPQEITLDEGQTVARLLEAAMQAHAERPAATCLSETLLFRDIERLSQAFANHVDNVVICAGQEPLRELYDELHSKGCIVHLIGGAYDAAELDAKRAIQQGTTLAAAL